MINSYLTIKESGHTKINLKKSDFICSIARTKTENEAQTFITTMKAQYPKANHNCFAYVIGERSQIQRESDNGEPSGTAGIPILEVLKKNELRDVTAVVTRFFGGIKLGTGGLIRAYTQAVSTAINNIGVVKCILQKIIYITISYAQHNRLKNFLEKNNITIINTEFTESVTVQIGVNIQELIAFKESTTNLLSAQVKFTEGPERYIEITHQLHT
ncbi:hypothetical protein FC19_GL001360 [Liquorilactobacillus aquaticus DSM 21051]|uniref:YigZ family protein n=1 Tax=Liquorilactobacillus aquaticus DSM 21051 TaxID=1423725 RepID=A0A0R2D5P0_9LACO|nr:YigZ family protein [Liquorilactobacillus aquaticus]KRM95881.1 hypothetical protein FC19_GL001360 [Liquorilactobacillus aquaticus DSM 21051]